MTTNWNIKFDQILYGIDDIYTLIENIYDKEHRICIYIQKENFNGELDNIYGLQFTDLNALISYVDKLIPNITYHRIGYNYISIDTNDKYRMTFILANKIRQTILDKLFTTVK